MTFRRIIFTALIIANLVWTTSAFSDPLVASFPSWAEARKAGCKKVFIRDPDKANCERVHFEGNTLSLGIYGAAASGEWKLEQQFQITDWYGMAKIDFPDVFGDGRRFVGVRFEGNTGTGVIQFIYLLIGWNRDHYEAAFFDTVEYRVSGPGEFRELKAAARIRRGAKPQLTMNYRYQKQVEGKAKLSQSWRDTFTWNPANFSFYDPAAEAAKLKTADPQFPGKAQISKSRLEFLKNKPNLERLDLEYLEKTDIMGVL